MLREIRYIFFSKQQAVEATLELYRARKKTMFTGSVKKIDIKAQRGIDLSFVVQSDQNGSESEYHITDEELAAAFVFYCINRKVPLPAAGVQKTLQVYGDDVALVISKGMPSIQLQDFISVP